jgi:hypothetical protein
VLSNEAGIHQAKMTKLTLALSVAAAGLLAGMPKWKADATSLTGAVSQPAVTKS